MNRSAIDDRERKETSMYARQQAALAELTTSVLANTDLSAIMRQAATLVADTLAVAYSAIWELLPDSGTLIFRYGAGWPEELADDTTVALATSPIGVSVLGAAPVIVEDWPSETRFARPPAPRDHGVISSLAVTIPGAAGPFGGLGVDVTAVRIFSDEEIHFVQAVANVLGLALERVGASRALDQQIEERMRAIEQRLMATAQERAVLEERQRLARDLHDSVTQSLYSVTLHTEAALRLLALGDVATASEYLRELQDIAQEALDEMRLLIFDLRPPILEQAGLVAALRARLGAVEGRVNLETRLLVEGVDRLAVSIEQSLYRIAQEALNNALKHAHARRITVHLCQEDASVLLEIADDGVGFDPDRAGETGGLGLRGIAERVAQLGGRFSVQSTAGAGTQLRVEVQL